jgi:hypothetical protein
MYEAFWQYCCGGHVILYGIVQGCYYRDCGVLRWEVEVSSWTECCSRSRRRERVSGVIGFRAISMRFIYYI